VLQIIEYNIGLKLVLQK